VKPRSARLKRVASLVAYWCDRRLVLANYRTNSLVKADPVIVSVLDFFDDWRSPEEFYSHLPVYTKASLDRALRQLLDGTFLVRKGSKEARDDAKLEYLWSGWLPAAGLLHFCSKNLAYITDLAQGRRLLRERAKRVPIPPAVKCYRSAPQLSLPVSADEGEFPGVLLRRRTWRRFSSRPVELSSLATLLRLSWGVQHWIKLPGMGRVALKTSPSAGARHPIEVYVLAVRVAGLPRGLYHYRSDVNRLELLKSGASPRQLTKYLAQQWWYGSAAALMIMTAVFPRTHWKYQDPCAYRTVLLDAGHACQTFCLVATWLGLAPFCTMALSESEIESDLRINGIEESVLYAAGVGTCPVDGNWAS
jgi:SagB-type dehydrogenase family enzyme